MWGSLDPNAPESWPAEPWQDAEAQANLRAIAQAKAAEEAKARTPGQVASEWLNAPYNLLKGLATQPANPNNPTRKAGFDMPQGANFGTLSPGEEAMMEQNSPASNVIGNLGKGLAEAAVSGATLPGDVVQGKVAMTEDGRTAPDLMKRAFDTASLAGGGAMGGAASKAIPQGALLAADAAKAGAPITAASAAKPFYSALDEVVAAAKMSRAPGAQWEATLKNAGVKPEELDWRGATQLFAAKRGQPITKAELEAHLQANPVPEVKPVNRESLPEWHQLTPEQRNKVEQDVYDRYDGDMPQHRWPTAEDHYAQLREDRSRNPFDENGNTLLTRYDDYQLPGGEKYRERLLTMPATDSPTRFKVGEGGGMSRVDPENFRGNHWTEPNVLVHRRSTDRHLDAPDHRSPDYLDEIEAKIAEAYPNSDRGAMASGMLHKSVNDGVLTPAEASAWGRFNSWNDPRYYDASSDKLMHRGGVKSLHAEEIQSDWHQAGRKTGYGKPDPEKFKVEKTQFAPGVNGYRVTDERGAFIADLNAASPEAALAHAREFFADGVSGRVPDAPFKKTWHELAAKDMIHEAIEGDYPRISWTAGKSQPTNPKNLGGTDAEAAARADKGLQGFYDKMMPDYLNKLGKKYGVEVKRANIADEGGMSGSVAMERMGIDPAARDAFWDGLSSQARTEFMDEARKKGHDVFYMDIPPAMKEDIRSRGFALFEDAGAAGAPIAALERASGKVDLSDLSLSEHGSAIASSAFNWGEKPKVSGDPVKVSISPTGEKYVLDGYHRIEDAKRSGKGQIDVDYVPWTDGIAARFAEDKIIGGTKNAGTEARLDVGRGLEGSGGGAARVAEAEAAAARHAGAVEPLAGLPRKPVSINGEPFVPGPIASVHDIAKSYMEGTGRPYVRQKRYVPINEEHSTAIAKAFDEMKHDPDNPKVKASYDAMVSETLDQYDALLKSGVKIEAIKPGMADPYAATPRLAAKDVAENNHLWFFPTEQGFGSGAVDASKHPLMRPSGRDLNGTPLLINDLFRVVHDYFGHLKEGNGFRAAGEDNAWRTHKNMYSETAQPAMTTETRGQNSWVNYGPNGEKNRTASSADTVYAEQKVGLLPDWVMRDPDTARPGIIDDKGLAIQGREFSKESTRALNEIKAGEKGAGPLDLSTQGQVPHVPQEPIERYVPPRGISPRMADALNNPEVIKGVEESMHAGKGVENWYHTEPLRLEFVKTLGEEQGMKAFSQYMDYVAATSPRSDVPTNIRNASYYYANDGVPEGKNPYPYGHVAQNLHKQNIETVNRGGGFDVMQNPKPASFAANLKGNLEPVTVDTHAFRNVAMRTKDPRFLETSFTQKRGAPGKNPQEDSLIERFGEFDPVKGVATFRPAQLYKEGKLTLEEAQKIPSFWASKPKANEYAATEKLFREIGSKIGMRPADAQAAAWSGGGSLTGLGTVGTHTFNELFNERVAYTAKMRKEDPKKVLRDFITKKKPLLSDTSAGLGFGSLDGSE